MSSFPLWTDRQKKHADGPLDDPTNKPRTLERRMADVLAFFSHFNGANGSAEAIGGRLETPHSMVLGFRSLDNYVTRSLPRAGGFRQAVQTYL